ncbi:hypothetical protein SLE2022_081130 [Rubroshorea leprosula]
MRFTSKVEVVLAVQDEKFALSHTTLYVVRLPLPPAWKSHLPGVLHEVENEQARVCMFSNERAETWNYLKKEYFEKIEDEFYFLHFFFRRQEVNESSISSLKGQPLIDDLIHSLSPIN